MVGSVANLVNEVLQAAVGNHFRNKLQSMPAVSFIASREEVQQGAFEYVKEELAKYRVETRGVYIQAVVLPEQLVQVLTQREIANQEDGDLQDAEGRAGSAHRDREGQRHGRHAGRSGEVAGGRGHPDQPDGRPRKWKPRARPPTSSRPAPRRARRSDRSVWRGRKPTSGRWRRWANATALVNAIEALSKSSVPFMPNTLVMGGSDGGGALEG